MGWKEWPGWLKGGLIGLIIGILYWNTEGFIFLKWPLDLLLQLCVTITKLEGMVTLICSFMILAFIIIIAVLIGALIGNSLEKSK